MRRLLEAGAVRASLSTVFQQLLRLTQAYCPIATGARVFRQDGSLLTISIAGGSRSRHLTAVVVVQGLQRGATFNEYG